MNSELVTTSGKLSFCLSLKFQVSKECSNSQQRLDMINEKV